MFIFLSLNCWGQNLNEIQLKNITELRRLTFGSCNSQFDRQPLWREIQQIDPDLFIWAGDNVYAESRDPELIKQAFDLQNNRPEYESFKRVTPIIGTWDDHDYAFDNARGNFPGKAESQKHILDFLGESEKSIRRSQKGIYTSYDFGSVDKKIKIILLDNRYFKDLEASAPLLGEAQWEWLDATLRGSDAKIHFIVGGLSILSPKLRKTDEWADYPRELKRLLGLIKKYQSPGIVFLAGDKHFASIFERHGHLEFMSSGMTHTAPRIAWKYLSSKYPNTYFGLNFGLIDIEWEGNGNPLLTMAIRTSSGKDVHRRQYRWVQTRWIRI
jgi:alkaline phosphatase D